MASSDLSSPFDCLLIDLDDTLYSSALGIGQACKNNIEEFLALKCGVSPERACSLRVDLFRSYGSSLAGLIALGYDVHPDEYHSYVHGRLPYELIKPDPQLREMLIDIQQPKILFTNSDEKHMRRTMERLGIEEECFRSFICFETMNPHLFEKSVVAGAPAVAAPPPQPAVILKPSTEAMEMAVKLAGFDPRRTLFLDDSDRNIISGKSIGLKTALVGKRMKMKMKEADYMVDGGMSCLRQVIPEIWGGEEEEEDDGDEEDIKKKKKKMMPLMRCEMDSNITPSTTQIQA